jgi:hypothetical protein
MKYLEVLKKRHDAFKRELGVRHLKRLWKLREVEGVRKLEVKCECNPFPFR